MKEPKLKTVYVCSNCGETSPRWMGRCPSCGSWNTMNEDVVAEAPKAGLSGGKAAAPVRQEGVTSLTARRLADISTTEEKSRILTGISELDRVLGGGAVLAGTQLLHFYSSDAAVIAAGYERLRVICGTYLLCGIMDTLASSLRGLGYSVLPMVVSLVGVCVLRLVWIATIFQLNRTPFMLYISYPISWALTALVHLACLLVVRHKMNESLKAAAQR